MKRLQKPRAVFSRTNIVLAFTALLLAAPIPSLRVSADALRADVAFLASDKLQGRLTPSSGLDAAADFIATQFQRAGLAPHATDNTYFQIADFIDLTQNLADFRLTLKSGKREVTLNANSVEVESANALDITDQPIALASEPITGKIAATLDEGFAALKGVEKQKPALILTFSRHKKPKEQKLKEAPTQLVESGSPGLPVVNIYDAAASALLSSKRPVTVSIHLPAPVRRNVKLRNVVGFLRGSDPNLRDQYVLLTAHYDHLGSLPPGPGDRIFNGANDNASGTASVIEIAAALANITPRPKRSIIFIALFGEEEGLLGSYYYVHHPLVPLAQTMAAINLEQMGRTDAADGRHVAEFGFTGVSMSSLPSQVSAVAASQGVNVYREPDSDDYFDRSDNYAFASAGVIAHTAVVAFEFPDYHAVGDEAVKLDYANMALVDRGVAAGVLELANTAAPPRWSQNKLAAPYRSPAF